MSETISVYPSLARQASTTRLAVFATACQARTNYLRFLSSASWKAAGDSLVLNRTFESFPASWPALVWSASPPIWVCWAARVAVSCQPGSNPIQFNSVWSALVVCNTPETMVLTKNPLLSMLVPVSSAHDHFLPRRLSLPMRPYFC